jgi:hypothetical protein
MLRLRILVPTLLGLLVLGALVASSASAVEGLLPLNLSGTLLSGKVKLETPDKAAISCGETKGSTKAETGSDTKGTLVLDFLKCEISGFVSFSLGDPEPKELKEALILVPGTYEVCLINSTALTFGLFIKLSETIHVHAKALGILTNLSGSIIGQIETSKGKLIKVAFTGKEGVQSVKECKNSAGEVKKAELKVEKDPSAALSASYSLEGGLLQFEKEVELMDT